MSAVRSPPADSEKRAERYGNGNYQAPILHDHPLRSLDSMDAQRQLTTDCVEKVGLAVVSVV
jgi:hypothetical protein